MPFVVTVHSLERLKSSSNLSLRLVMVQHEPLKVQNIVYFFVHLHWAKANAKPIFFFDLCRCSMRTLNWILHELI